MNPRPAPPADDAPLMTVVDDDRRIRQLRSRFLQNEGYRVSGAESATAIAGEFANLADGSTFVLARNKFQVDYQGGDGNDLTLTVVP